MSTNTVSRPRWTQRRREALWFYLMVSPWLVGFVVFLAGPLLASAYLSLTDYDLLTPPHWVGLANYVRMFTQDPLFWKVLRNTAYYTFLAVPLSTLASVALAALLNKPVPGMRIYRTIVYLPALVPLVASAMLFGWVLAPDAGLVNRALALVGVHGPAWLLEEAWVIPALVLMSLWGVGTGVVLLLATMQGIPSELLEAATIDGAGPRQRFFRIVLPMLSPVILFNVVMGLIGAFQVFSQVYILTGGGPNNASETLVPYIFEEGFKNYRMGYASALSWLLFAVIMVCTAVVFRSSSRWVFYESEVHR
ncbi:multiple sugar transport system permease protein [Actinopolymorpha cephalotaxi]|uniref:Multiple sugar transport system permease protein n=1 Tax=Actinopolymorpha cephalotaxi TaxID=504797 RepID=A0A1I2LIJ2_9ACTN|nr:sugar ABC transporter permease [Actinopolymorpha cephalotaxi]NYH84898.1 multiple sugar transport system permease protein [Actinopolymorpha cephalotaxi]SFF78270.1 multiple sugar transport system permease protein [Actinopolymorpha cephalotaxi]